MREKASKQIVLKKHINTIHCSNNLTLMQRKLFNALLYYAYSNLPTQHEFTISIKELCRLIGYNSHDYDALKSALKKLMSIVIEWNVIDYSAIKHSDKWQASSILACITLERGFCRYEYSSALRELLYRPEIYGRICLETQSKFKSSYGLALYENCIRYKGIPQTPWFTIETFRKLMGVTERKYAIFKDFKKRVIDIALSEVNQYSNITISLETKKENRRIVALRFRIFEKSDGKINKSSSADVLVQILINDFKISIDLARKLLERYPPSYIQEKVNLILNSKSYREGKIDGMAGYLLGAIKSDYKNSPSSTELVNMKRKLLEEKESKEKGKEAELEKVKLEYNNYLINAAERLIATTIKSDLKKIINEFLTNASNKNDLVTLDIYKRTQFKEKIMKLYLAFFLRDKRLYPNIFITMEDFLVLNVKRKSIDRK